LREDYLQLHEFKDFAEAYRVITKLMWYYNEMKLHSDIGYPPPHAEYQNEIMREYE
jgi:hypothetical protein